MIKCSGIIPELGVKQSIEIYIGADIVPIKRARKNSMLWSREKRVNRLGTIC